MKHRFTVNGQLDLRDAVQFYNDQRAGLGYEFAVEVGMGIAKIREAPQSWLEVEPGVRRYRLDRFPYGIFYRLPQTQLVEVVAVFDLRAEPGSWRRLA
jgi:toxin ParE1/3/4